MVGQNTKTYLFVALETEKEARTQTDTVFSITTAPQVNENETTGGGVKYQK